MTSEDTSDGQPKGYSHDNGKIVVYNHRVEAVGQSTQNPRSVGQPTQNPRS